MNECAIFAGNRGLSPITETNNALAAAATVTVNSGVAQAYYIHADQLDTPRQITDTSGNVVWQWDNTDPFGNNMANENPNGAGTFSFPLRFPGQYYDRETNLHYNVNRDFDPAIGGRYLESDPIGLAGGINTYIYVNDNPISLIDGSGLGGHAPGSIGKNRQPYTPPTMSGGIGGCWGAECVNYNSQDDQAKLSVPFPPDVGGGVSICMSPAKSECPSTREKKGKAVNIGLGKYLGFTLNNDGGFCINIGLALASPVEVTTDVGSVPHWPWW